MDPYVSRFRRLALSAAIGAGMLGGCALTTRNATLIYPPASSQGAVAVAQAATPSAPSGITIAVLPFVDQRSDKTKVGDVRNGFGMKLAPIRTVNSVPEWVRDAVALELKNAGYNAATSTTVADSSLAVEGDILNVRADAYLSYGGTVELLIRLRKGGRELIRHTYAGKGSAGTSWGATAKSYAQSLALALADALRQIVPDVERATTSD